MKADDLADARRIDDRRTADALQGREDRDTGPAPALRGLGWGVLVAVVVAVVLFASVLVVEGRARERPPASPEGVVAAAPSVPATAAPSTPSPATPSPATRRTPPRTARTRRRAGTWTTGRARWPPTPRAETTP